MESKFRQTVALEFGSGQHNGDRYKQIFHFFGLRENPFNINPDPRYLSIARQTQCLSSIILSPLNGYVKMSPYEQGDICIEPERATTRGSYLQMREGRIGVCQSRRTPVPERAPN